MTGAELRHYRIINGLSCQQLADKIGITRQGVWSCERKPVVSKVIALAVARVLDLPHGGDVQDDG